MDPAQLDEQPNPRDRGSLPLFGGRYQARRHLARGGMADVFEAQDVVLDRKVAVKVMFPQFAGDPKFAARFRREATSAAGLSHADIVRIYDWGPHEDSFYIAMEYLDGVTLADMLAESGPMPIETSIAIAADVAAALDYAHVHGTVHRDVKPANIVVMDGNQVKVADFGIARAIEGDENLTEAGMVLGTASYFSPEQAQGLTVDPRSDLYSLGVILFEMVTGALPFQAPSAVALALKHVRDQPPRPRSLNPAVSPELDDLIMRLLAKDPDDRPPTAKDVVTALRQLLNPTRPSTAPAGAAGAAAAAMGSTSAPPESPVMSTTVMPTTDRPDWQPARPERPGRQRIEPDPEPTGSSNAWMIFVIAFLLVGVVIGLLFLPTVADRLADLGNGGTDQPDDSPATDPAPTDVPQSTTPVEETTTTPEDQTTTESSATTAPSSTATTAPATTASTAAQTTAPPTSAAASTSQ